MLVRDVIDRAEQVEQDGRGDVVRQVADDPQRPARLLREGGEVDGQHVGLDHLELGPAPQARRQVAIELDDGQPAAARHERIGHGAESRPDLHQRIAGPRVDHADDAVDDGAVGEEMLAEALARDVFQAGGSRSSM